MQKLRPEICRDNWTLHSTGHNRICQQRTYGAISNLMEEAATDTHYAATWSYGVDFVFKASGVSL